MGREGAGHRAAITRRANRLRAIVERESAAYDTPGKRKVRAMLVRLAVESGCGTWAELWGGGTSARLAAGIGLNVTSAERTRSLHDAAAFDAERNGYSVFAGSASRMTSRHDFWYADFMGSASRQTARELKAIAAQTDKWLAVTLSPDHQLDEILTGPAAPATIAVWLVVVTGLPCVYLEKYRRNERGQWMWLAILGRREAKFGDSGPQLAPANILRQMARRGWWATGGFMKKYPDVVPRPTRFYTAAAAQRLRDRYLKHQEVFRARSRARCQAIRARMADDPDFAESHRLKRREQDARRRARGPSRPKAARPKATTAQ